MKTTITKSAFRDAFHAAGRSGSWSYDGLGALYDYLTDMESDTGTEIELDVVGLDYEWTEYASAKECCDDFGLEVDLDGADPEEAEARCRDYLEAETTVIQVGNTGRVVVRCGTL